MISKQVKVTEFRLKLYPKDFYLVKDFYRYELGLRILEEWDRSELNKGVMFEVGDAVLELLMSLKEYQAVQGADVSWRVQDIHELWKTWRGKQNVVFELRDNEWGDTSFCISDPEGFRITFFTPHE
jgi:catechol 2,3-dioxygenase-like lactoylglutathione lyase family enzyme